MRHHLARHGDDGSQLDVAAISGPSIALGAFVPGAPGDPSRLDAFARMVGAMPAVVSWFQAWGAEAPDFTVSHATAVASRGAVPMITWEPWCPRDGLSQPIYAPRAIAAGACDAYVRRWARAAAGWAGPLLVRLAHEMNGRWYPWCAGVGGNSSIEYVAAWRHVVDAFRRAGAINVRWVWSPNVEFPGSRPFEELYPGDDYTDFVALDGYNAGTTGPPHAWRSLAQVFLVSYQRLSLLTTRPLLLAELASDEQGGDKASWIRDGLLRDVPSLFPRVRAVIWFNERKRADWPVDSSPAALSAFREVAASRLYHACLAVNDLG